MTLKKLDKDKDGKVSFKDWSMTVRLKYLNKIFFSLNFDFEFLGAARTFNDGSFRALFTFEEAKRFIYV